jgi:CrcB protein
MINFFLVFVGAGLGGIIRYWCQLTLNKAYYALPLGTIAVNLIGCYAIGLLYGISESKYISKHINTFLVPGMLGGFTTFSAFSLETLVLIHKGKYLLAVTHILLSVGGGLVFAYLGYRSMKFVIGS